MIVTIGLFPIVLALSVRQLYEGSKLSKGLYIIMILMTVWQFFVGSLYFGEILSEETIYFLFRLLRFGPTFAIPTAFYIICTILEDHPAMDNESKWLKKMSQFLFNKKNLTLITLWTLFIYVINWTSLGVKGLKLVEGTNDSISFYFPEYGPLGWLYIVHMCTFVVLLTTAYFISRKIINRGVRGFLKGFSIYSILMYFLSVSNFFPGTGVVGSTIGVILFCTLIMFEYVKLNNNMKMNYYQLMERQKKLDYTGSLTASLIHEVKNTNQIIKGFSKMLNKDDSMEERERSSVEMILKSSEHLGDLASNYKEYMKTSKMDLKLENLGLVIDNAIDFSQEITNEYDVEIEFINHYDPLNAFVNRTYLEQVFINLIKNSVEAFHSDKKNKKITIKTEIVNNSIFIHFHDNGKGVPIDNWECIFDPFMSFKEKGMGLGLPFVKKVIIEHLGDVSIVESTPEGTHFQIELPQNGILNMEQ